MEKIFWVGNRASDIIYNQDEFIGYICLYGKNNNINYFSNAPIRKNNSIIDDSSNNFFINAIDNVVSKYPNSYFMFYNPLVAFKINSPHMNRFLCLNETALIRLFDDKIQCHSILNQFANFCPFITLFGEDISFEKLSFIFPGYEKFVIQESKSAAGLGTFIINQTNFKEIKNTHINPNLIYLVSAFQKNSRTFNIHTIFDEKTILEFPPSFSYMECLNGQMHYRGSSYIKAKNIIGEKNIQNAQKMIYNIIYFLRKFNYRGILGFDFLFTKTSVFLLELNLRFQGLSNILNKMLKDANLPSLFTLNRQAFNNELQKIDLNKINTEYANIFYYNDDGKDIDVPYKLCEEYNDNLSEYMTFEKGAYLQRKIYGTN